MLSGCGVTAIAPSSDAVSEAAIVSGKAHGGQQPIYNAVVRLYMAGASGYGAGSTLLATSANTDAGGNFSFTKLPGTGGVVAAGATPVWQCPVTGNPIIYITAIGGNTQGTGTTTVNNSASALLAAIGPCNGISSSTQVGLNEIATVASVFALAQYMNPGTTAGTETLGTAATTQAAVGLTNAYNSIQNMANISSGLTVQPPTYAGATTSVSNVVVTATAESAKITTIANILAACINTPAGNSTQCADLFANALPPISASSTSLGTLLTAPAVDTIQAAYYMATNPASLGTFTSCTGGSTTTMSCLFNLASAQSPFQTGLATQPSDWTIGITYSSTGTCAGTGNGPFIQGPIKTAIDASGNIWFVGGATTSTSATPPVPGQNISEMSPVGQPLLCLGNFSAARGLTIDPTGNVWASFNASGQSNDVQELPVGGSALIAWPTSAVSATSYGLGSDGLGNIYFTGISNGGFVYRFASPGTSTTPTAPTPFVGPLASASSGTNNTTYLAFDPSENLWIAGSSNSSIYNTYTASDAGQTAAITAFALAHSGSNAYSTGTFTTSSAAPFTAGQQITLSGFTSAGATTAALNGMKVYVSTVTSTTFTAVVPTSTTFTTITTTSDNGVATAATIDSVSTATTATPYGMALDNAGNAYSGATCCSTTASYKVLTKLVPGTNGTAATIARSAQYIGGVNGVRSLALDGAGNIWAGNEYSSTGDLTAIGNVPVAEVAVSTSGTTTTFTALSPTGTALSTMACSTTVGCPTGGGFLKSDILEARDLAIDPSGSVWVMNTGTESATCTTYCGATIVQIVGAAVPVVTPVSIGVANTKLATKP